jgi:Short C-terminal domain
VADSDDVRRAAREVMQELGRALEQAGRKLEQIVRERGTWSQSSPPPPAGTASDEAPLDLIRKLGELRDAGLVTEEEFQAKKAELLGKV